MNCELSKTERRCSSGSSCADLPWVRLGGAYFLMAAVVSLPMVGRSLIINQRLRLPPDVSTAFYMVTWLPSLAAPIFGRLTDMHAPSRRYIATAGLVIEAIFQFIYATGLVDSLGMLYVVAVPISMAHVAAQACVDGILQVKAAARRAWPERGRVPWSHFPSRAILPCA